MIGLFYSNALTGEFLYDDEFLIQKNQIIQNVNRLPEAFLGSSTSGSGGKDSFYRPLQTVSYSLIHALFGLDPFWFHFLNVFVHFLNAVLLLFLLEELFKRWRIEHPRGFSLAIVLIWALHPIHTEAVSYASATADPLHFFFGLIFLRLSFLGQGKGRKGLGLLALSAALLTKEAAVIFPGVLFCTVFSDAFYFQKEKLLPALKKSLYLSLPALLLALVYAYLRSNLLDFDHSFQFYQTDNVYTSSWYHRLCTALAALPSYLHLLFWPDRLQIDRNFPVFISFFSFPVLLGSLIFVFSLIPLVAGSLLFSFFSLWFWSSHVLNTGILLPLNSLFLEHWMYVPSVGVVGACVQAGRLIFKKIKMPTKAVVGILILLCTALGARTFVQNKVWHSPVSLYEHILEGSPDVARVHNNLAMALSDEGKLKEAEGHYLKSIEIDATYPQTWHNLGLLHLQQGKIDEGIENLKHAVSLNPNFFPSYLYLSKAYLFKGDKEKSQAALRKYQETRRIPSF